MKSGRRLLLHIFVMVSATLVPAAAAIQTPGQFTLSYMCTDVSGSTIAAPNWRAERDGAAGQHVLVRYRGDKEIGDVSWAADANGAPYYEASGFGVSMRSGFAIFVFAPDYVETYVYNAGTTELFYSSVRSGSSLLPNSIKSFKGSCKPAGTR